MSKVTSKISSLALATLMAVSSFPMGASAAEAAEYAFEMDMPETLVVSDTAPEEANASVTLKGLEGATTYDHALILVDITEQPEESNPKVMATDTLGQEHNLAEVKQWGPAEGFQVTAETNSTTELKIALDVAGDYEAKFTLVDLDNEKAELVSGSCRITAEAEPTEPGEGEEGGETTKVVATINGTNYDTFEAALEKVQSGETIEAKADWTMTADATIPADVTMSFGEGTTLTIPADTTLTVEGTLKADTVGTNIVGQGLTSKLAIAEGGQFTLSDSSEIIPANVTYMWSWIKADGSDSTVLDGSWKTEKEHNMNTAKHWKAVVAESAAEDDVYYPTWEAVEGLATGYANITQYAEDVEVKDAVAEVKEFIESITKINMDGKQIPKGKTTDVLGAYINVTSLSLANTGISEISVATTLAKIETLNLSGNAIVSGAEEKTKAVENDLADLNSLTALKSLDISNNSGITSLDFSKAAFADTLETLIISDTEVTDFDFMWDSKAGEAVLSKLATLTACNLDIASLSGLSSVAKDKSFKADKITAWNLDGSTIAPELKDDMESITTAFGSTGKFTQPDVTTSGTDDDEGGTPPEVTPPAEKTYAVKVSTLQDGSVTTSKNEAKKGDTITIYVAPASGYEATEVTVKDSKGTEVKLTRVSETAYTFEMPAGDVTVSALFKETNPLPFMDVEKDDWFYDFVKFAYDEGIMAGTSSETFSPRDGLNRGMVVQMLYNMEDQPAVTIKGEFEDVIELDWYAKPVYWAFYNGIVAGYSSTEFGPRDNITREQMAMMLYNYAKHEGYVTTATGSLKDFTDGDKVSSWASNAMKWAIGHGIMSGRGNKIMDPKGTATRAEAATIMSNFYDNIVNAK